MAIIDTLITRYTMDPSGYVTGAAKVKAASAEAGAATNAASGVLSGIGSAATVAGVGLAAVAVAIVGIGASLARAAVPLMQEAAKWDSYSKSLQAVEGSAKGAADAMARLQMIAKAPGIGMQQAIQSYTGLRQNGMSSRASEFFIQQAGNANALAGGSKETFGRIMLALKQIAMTDFLQGDELNQLSESGVAGRKMIRDKFGTADTEKLKQMGITSMMVLKALGEGMADLPRVAGGAQNSFDNLGDAISFAQAKIGEQLNKAFLPAMDAMATAISDMASSGVLSDVAAAFTQIQTAGLSFKDGLLGIAAFLHTIGNIMVQLGKGNFAGAAMSLLPSNFIANTMGTFAKYRGMMGAEADKHLAPADATALQDLVSPITAPIVQQHQTLQKIENNTRKALDIQRQVFGGGAIGEKGVSAADVAGFTKGKKSGGKAKLDDAVRMIAAYVVEEIGMHRLREVRAKVGSL